MRGAHVAAPATVSALGLVGWLCVRHGDDVLGALATVSPWGLAAALWLHLATLGLRSEAWRMTLCSVQGHAIPRGWVHAANAAAFVAGSAQSQAALPVRVAVLRRVAGDRAPRAAQICMADVPIFALELCAIASLLFAAAVTGLVAAWVAPVALAVGLGVLVGARCAPRRLPHFAMLRGLAVLADRGRRRRLVAVVVTLAGLGAARVWVVLLACGLPHGMGHVAATFAALGAFGLLPLGPGAPAGATLAAAGSAGTAAAVAAGLVFSATSIAAVLVYAIATAALTLGARPAPAGRRSARGPLRDRPQARLAAVQLERAKAREAAVAGAVEVG